MLLYTLMIFCLSGIAYLGVDPGFGRYLYPLHTQDVYKRQDLYRSSMTA